MKQQHEPPPQSHTERLLMAILAELREMRTGLDLDADAEIGRLKAHARRLSAMGFLPPEKKADSHVQE